MSDSIDPTANSPSPDRLPAKLPAAPTARRPVPHGLRPKSTAQQQGISPQFVWRVFTAWWAWVVPLGIVLSTAVAAVVWLLHVPKFESSALIKIEAEAPFIAFDQGKFSHDSERYVQTQIELLRGPVVLSPVLARPEIASLPEIKKAIDPLEHLQKNLTVHQIGKSELYEVSYVAPSASNASAVANSVVAQYLDLQNEQEQKRLHIVLKVLEDERLQRGQNVERLRKRVVDLAREVTGKDPFGQGVITDPVAFTPATSLYQSLTEAEVDFEVLKAELQGLKNAPIMAEDTERTSGLLDLEIANRTDVRRLEDQLLTVQEQLTTLTTRPQLKIGESIEDSPAYVQLKAKEQQIEKALQELRASARQDVIAARREQRNAERASLMAAKQSELDMLTKKRQMLAQKLEVQMGEIRKGGAQSAELEFAKAELEREQNVFELIAARKLALQTEQRAPARVTLMQKAVPPQIAIEPIPYKFLLLGGSVGLLAPLGLALLYELLARRISSTDDLMAQSSLPVLGEVARFPRQYLANQAQLSHSSHHQREALVFAESVDSLRTQLMLTEQVGVLGQQRIVAICSAASGEGKSSLTTSLAISVAEATKRPTLLIDADLRAPDIAQLLNVPSRPGIAELLEGKVELEQAIHRVGRSSAYVLPAGRLKGSPHHIFEGFKIDNLLERLRDDFDTIFIDTPPVLAASDSLVYAKCADLVLFCSLADTSRATQVRYAVERLQATGANIVGAVLSGVSAHSYAYRYGTYGRDV